MKNIGSLISGKLRMMLTGLFIVSAAAVGYPLSYPATNSPLSSGRWVKIKVTRTGMQQITFDQLRQWGFANPDEVYIYGFGGAIYWDNFSPTSMPDDLPSQPTVTFDDRIVFYGESETRPGLEFVSANILIPNPERNILADAGYYFISDVKPSASTEPLPLAPMGGTVISNHYSVRETEEEYVKPNGLGLRYFGRPLSEYPDNTLTYDFEFPDRIGGTPVSAQFPLAITDGTSPGVVAVSLPGLSTPRTINISLPSANNEATMSTTGSPNANRYYTYNPTFPDPENERGTFSIAPDASNGAFEIYPDFIAIGYRRNNNFANAEDGQLRMILTSADAQDRIAVSNADTSLRIWNVTRPNQVIPYEVEYMLASGTVQATLKDNITFSKNSPATVLIAFDPNSTFYDVEYAGAVKNSNLHAMEVPELLIISTELLRPQAERLGDIHRELLGHKVAVVGIDEIYNEFSSGTPSLCGIRRFIGKLKWRPGSKLSNVLLFGPGTNDPRGLGVAAPYLAEKNIIPTYTTPTYNYSCNIVNAFSCDAYFVRCGETMTSEKDLFNIPMTINIGRIPAKTVTDATIAVDKIKDYITNVPTVDAVNRTLILTDPSERLSHLQDGEAFAQKVKQNRPYSTIVKTYVPLFPLQGKSSPVSTEAIKQALRNGVGFFDFTGHANYSSFTKISVWTLHDILNTAYNHYPVGMFATCESYPFDMLETGMTDAMLFQPEGGIIAGIGGCRRTWTTCNQILNNSAALYYSTATAGTSIGDLHRSIVNANLTSSYTGMSQVLAGYNLCGDPALPLKVGENNRIALNRLNGEAFTTLLPHTIQPLTANTFEGYIKLPGSNDVDTSFNGTVFLTIYEVPRVVNVCDNNEPVYTADVTIDYDQLLTVEAPVVDGRFTLNLTSPLPSRKGDPEDDFEKWHNRATILAVDNDNKHHFVFNFVNLLIDPNAPDEVEEVTPPSINTLYIDDPRFADGDMTGPDIKVYAEITPGPGAIKMTTGSIGGMSSFSIDGVINYPIYSAMLSATPEGNLALRLPVNDLTDGRHNGLLSIIDNFGNTTTADINFVVSSTPATATLSIAENVARVQATFNLSHTFGSAPSGRLVVEDVDGNVVWSRDNCQFPCEWDLTDGDQPVADGAYHAYAILKSGLLYASTPRVTINVVQSNR